MNHLLDGITHIPPLAIYLFVTLWLAAESCGLPLPNELVLLLAGSVAARNTHPVSPIILVILATAGSLAGAIAAYTIGERGGRTAVLALGKRLRIDEQRIDGLETWFSQTGPVAIFVSRITPFVRTVASFPAGMLRLPRQSFLIATVSGSLIWCSVMVGLGVALGANYDKALVLIERFTLPAILVLAALVALYFWLHNKLAHVGEAPLKPTEKKAADDDTTSR